MKQYDKYIKSLLLILNQNGIEVNYETKLAYSQKFNALVTTLYLKIWKFRIDIDKNTGKQVAKPYCKQIEFKGAYKYVHIIDYLKECISGKEKE